MTELLLSCPKCKRTQSYARTIDPNIPADVAVVQIICDKCDDGDFHTETWFDAEGKEVVPDEKEEPDEYWHWIHMPDET